MSAASWSPDRAAVLWDVDGTLVESTKLAFDATNEVLLDQGCNAVSVEQYKVGCRYTTPERFNYHLGLKTGDPKGAQLGQIFDDTYVARVSEQTAGLFDGIDRLLRSLTLAGHPQGALSNACGAYVRAVMAANRLDDKPGERIGIMKIALGADEVPMAKPHPDGLLLCCERLAVRPENSVYVGDSPSDGKAARAAGMRSVGVLWGANDQEALRDSFDTIAADVPELIVALRGLLAPAAEERES
jgi:phosphoglycolate phosphatase-like HAD superfamily hydrolase